jgi:phosphatidylinositol-4,5-bisphosphate 3-kinase catalytic subunit alpha/beta/delta
MLSTGIPELQSEEDIQYLQQALAMHLSDEDAGKHFSKLIQESLDSMSTQLMFVTHIMAHRK